MVDYDNSRLGADLGMDIARENGVLPDDEDWDLPTGPGKRVTALRLLNDIRVVGEMLPPIDGAERVRDDDGAVWFVRSSTVEAAPLMAGIDLQRDTERGAMYGGGTIAYRVYHDGTWIGWVGDGREWRGWRYGSRRWFACWRQVGDTAARWNTELDFATRKAAVDALAGKVS